MCSITFKVVAIDTEFCDLVSLLLWNHIVQGMLASAH
jgi:hypothetical protein